MTSGSILGSAEPGDIILGTLGEDVVVDPYASATFVTLADAKRWLAISSDTYDSNVQEIVDAACAWIVNELGRPVIATTYFQRFDGPGRPSILLPYVPVISIQSVTEWRGGTGYTLVQQTPETQGTDGYQLDSATGLLIRTFADLQMKPWYPGVMNIEVTWTAGFATVPADLMLAARVLINAWYRNELEATRTSGRLPNGSDFDPAAAAGWQGVPSRAQALLEPYIMRNFW